MRMQVQVQVGAGVNTGGTDKESSTGQNLYYCTVQTATVTGSEGNPRREVTRDLAVPRYTLMVPT